MSIIAILYIGTISTVLLVKLIKTSVPHSPDCILLTSLFCIKAAHSGCHNHPFIHSYIKNDLHLHLWYGRRSLPSLRPPKSQPITHPVQLQNGPDAGSLWVATQPSTEENCRSDGGAQTAGEQVQPSNSTAPAYSVHQESRRGSQ